MFGRPSLGQRRKIVELSRQVADVLAVAALYSKGNNTNRFEGNIDLTKEQNVEKIRESFGIRLSDLLGAKLKSSDVSGWINVELKNIDPEDRYDECALLTMMAINTFDYLIKLYLHDFPRDQKFGELINDQAKSSCYGLELLLGEVPIEEIRSVWPEYADVHLKVIG